MDSQLDIALHIGACAFCSALAAFARSRRDEAALQASCSLVYAHATNVREQRAWSRRVRETLVQRWENKTEDNR